MNEPEAVLYFYLVRFGKTGAARYISQHDTRRSWERASRRAGLPLAYSRGFSPRPRLSFGAPLPVGAIGLREYMVMALYESLKPGDVHKRLSAASIEGLPVVDVTESSRGKARPLWADYDLSLLSQPEDLTARVARLRGDNPVLVARGGVGNERDIRPGVLDIQILRDCFINARLSLEQDDMVTPRDLTVALTTEFSGVTRRDIALSDDT